MTNLYLREQQNKQQLYFFLHLALGQSSKNKNFKLILNKAIKPKREIIISSNMVVDN